MRYIENKTFDEINIGDSATLTRVVTKNDIELFSSISGDVNPAHVDVEFAKNDIFHGVVVHGMWGASLISTVLGTILPGPGTIYLNQSLKFLHPIIPGDNVVVKLTVLSKDLTKHRIELNCECFVKHDVLAIQGIALVIAPIEKIKRQAIEIPTAVLEYSHDKLYSDMLNISNGMEPLKVAVVHPVDAESLIGAISSYNENIIEPILVGPKTKILQAALGANLDISRFKIIDTPHSHASAEIAVSMVRSNQVEALMKGHIHTDELMSFVVDKQNGIRTSRRMSHVFALQAPNYHKPLFLTDAALNIFPNLVDKVDIVQNAVDLFNGLGFGIPKVAIVSAAETVNGKLPSTMDAAALCKMADRGQITDCIIDGPLAFDNAISKKSAEIKGINSPVAGDADIIVTPDLESGNMLYKQMTYLSNVEAAGIVMGASVPIILTSRASNELSRKMSCLMALLFIRNKTKTCKI